MSDMKPSAVSNSRISSTPDAADTATKSPGASDRTPTLRSESRGGPESSLLAQAKKNEPLAEKVSIAFCNKSDLAMHEALLEAVLKQDYDGIFTLVNTFHTSPPTGSARLLFDTAVNMRSGNGNIILNAAMMKIADAGEDLSSKEKIMAVRIANMVRTLGADEAASSSLKSEPRSAKSSDVSYRPDGNLTPVEHQLFHAIATSDEKTLNHILSNNDLDLNQLHPHVQSPLIFAAQQKNGEIVKILLNHGADVNFKNKVGNTALHFAAIDNRTRIIDVLMANEADYDIRNDRDETPFNCAARHGNARAMQTLIEWHIDTGSEELSMLEHALKNGHAEAAEVLVSVLIKEAKRSSTKSTLAGMNLALYAVAEHGGSRRLMRQLVRAGADVNYVYPSGKTALMVASKFGHTRAVEWLVNHGAQRAATDLNDQTALDLAKRYGRTEVVRLFEAYLPSKPASGEN